MAYTNNIKNQLLESIKSYTGGSVATAGGLAIQIREELDGGGTVIAGANVSYGTASSGSMALSSSPVVISVPDFTDMNSVVLVMKESGEGPTTTDCVILIYKNFEETLNFSLPNNIVITSATITLLG